MTNRTLIILFLIIGGYRVCGQNSTIQTDNTSQNFGELENINNIQSEFIIKNNGTKNLYILRADTKPGIKVRINNKTIAPGDTSTLYVYIEPKMTGKFNENIQLITSADALPYVLSVKGDIKSIKIDDKTACYYFNKPSKKSPVNQPVFIPVVYNKPVVPDTLVRVIPDTLQKPPAVAIEPPVVIAKDTVTETLDRRIYKPNNITFLIDVSSSMRDSLKLPLMKEAMYALIITLRDIDNVNIITYSDSARIKKEGVQGDNKQELNACVAALKAKGSTMGAQAILFSIDIALNHYLQNGNNQLFLITDGQFKFTDEHYKLWQQKTGDKKIILTNIGLGKDIAAINQLKDMATKREGSFIWIKSHSDAKTEVLDEIKQRAKK